ncbi:MAG: WecB/TagA/CpsF family glycosyltransferase [Oscillospiraceae bacterium]|nr:WecB/TagA/CpsF family glycosyltransferase [Oscillospiraceae bacterium]
MRIDILGVGFDAVTPDEAIAAAAARLDGARPGTDYIVTPNPEIVEFCRRDADAADAISGAFLVLPDGIGIIYAAKILGRQLCRRVPGIDFACALLARGAYRVFLLGAKPGVAARAGQAVAARYPGVVIAGCRDGYFADDAEVVAQINAAAPDIVFVCLGAPKQEKWMAQNAPALNAKLLIGLGGALDVLSGDTRRAPRFMQRLGLEWLYRIVSQPRRIGRMARLPLFLLRALKARING